MRLTAGQVGELMHDLGQSTMQHAHRTMCSGRDKQQVASTQGIEASCLSWPQPHSTASSHTCNPSNLASSASTWHCSPLS